MAGKSKQETENVEPQAAQGTVTAVSGTETPMQQPAPDEEGSHANDSAPTPDGPGEIRSGEQAGTEIPAVGSEEEQPKKRGGKRGEHEHNYVESIEYQGGAGVRMLRCVECGDLQPAT